MPSSRAASVRLSPARSSASSSACRSVSRRWDSSVFGLRSPWGPPPVRARLGSRPTAGARGHQPRLPGQLARHVLAGEVRAVREHHQPLHEVLQLAHVARPRLRLERLERVRRQREGLAPVGLGVHLQEVPGQRLDVLRPGPQRRQPHRHHVEPVEEVLAELALLHHLLERPVRGRHEAHVHLQRLRAAEPLELALLQHPQQLHLHVQGDVANLVQEERAAVRQLHPARLARGRPGEGALLVAEQLALQQRLRQRRAVQLHEGPRARGGWRRESPWPPAPCPCRTRRAAAPSPCPPRPASAAPPPRAIAALLAHEGARLQRRGARSTSSRARASSALRR